ncbi:MAG TPA: metallopeptidase TldD-related protein [Thermoanaerobaculia bacterium]|nr:metallopeptidase TldD-related protein [Thermoanaerobaculia bacterium]
MSRAELASLDEMMARLERALAASPADSTEIVWIEARRTQVTAGRGRRDQGRAAGPGGRAPCERNLLVRVRQSGRTGLHRTGGVEPSELENAVRDAAAQARLAPPTPAEPLAGAGDRRGTAAATVATAAPAAGGAASAGAPAPAAGPGGPGPGRGDAIYDPELAELEAARARALLDGAAERGELLRLSWLEGRVTVVNSAGLRQAARVTAASFEASCGRGPGAGRAAGAARRLDTLYLQDTLDRARARHAAAPAGDDAGDEAAVPAAASAGLPMVLSEQSAAALIALLNRHALSAAAQRDPGCGLHGRLGGPVLASCLSLRDDGTDPRALPFPFDLAGWPKRQVDLFVDGVFATPAVDARLAAEIGHPSTPHGMAPDESIAANLLLLPGDREPLPEAELLRQAADGIWIGALDGLECFDPGRLRFRARVRGGRRIDGDALGPPLPDFLWEDDLLAALARAAALGDRPATIATGDMLFGATVAPLLALRAAER